MHAYTHDGDTRNFSYSSFKFLIGHNITLMLKQKKQKCTYKLISPLYQPSLESAPVLIIQYISGISYLHM